MWLLKGHKKTEKKPEDRSKKDRPARRPKGSGPRPPEDRKMEDRNITTLDLRIRLEGLKDFIQLHIEW